jgi:hypothetical protein
MKNKTWQDLAKNVWDLADLTGDENIIREVEAIQARQAITLADKSNQVFQLNKLLTKLVGQVNKLS